MVEFNEREDRIMNRNIRTAVIGMDTSHAVEFPKYIQDPAQDAATHVPGMTVTRALRFETPFQNAEGLDARQAYLESIGVKVTEDFDEAVADCDAVFLEINDPSLHLPYFRKCAKLGKPVFLDKPFAATLAETNEILRIAAANKVRFFTASSLRYDADVEHAAAAFPSPEFTHVWGPLGKAAAGSSVVWYGVHSFEMLEKLMGPGALNVSGIRDQRGAVFSVSYPDGRRGIVELSENCGRYGGVLRRGKEMLTYQAGRSELYPNLIGQIGAFFRGEQEGVPLAESYEIMAMLEAAEKSIASGHAEEVRPIPPEFVR